MRLRSILLGCLLPGLLSGHVAAADDVERAAKPSLSFGVIADVQYADRDTASGRHFRASLERLEECVADLNSRDLDFTIQLGDVIDREAASFDRVLPLFDRLTMPRYHVLGNHDFPMPREQVLSKLGLEAAYYTFSYDGWCFVVLDTVDIAMGGGWPEDSENYRQARQWVDQLRAEGMSEEETCNRCGVGERQKQWLRDTFRQARERGERVIVFGHIPVVAAPGGEWALIHNHEEIREVLESAGCVVAYFNGHDHGGGYACRDGIHYVTVEGMVQGPDGTAYATVDVFDDRLEIRGIGRTPSRELALPEDVAPVGLGSQMDAEKEDAVKLQPLPKGISTWVYRYSDGISRQVHRFNSRALPHLRFKYFFPYAGSVGFNGRAEGQATVHYSSEAVSAYAEALPSGTLIMPIVDGRADKGEFSGWTDEQYHEAARKVAKCIIDDPHAAGVQIDIEPFKPDHLPFYRHLTEMLNAEGKHCTMFVGPKRKDLLTRIFQSCNVVVMSGYDLNGEGMELDAYRAAMKGSLARFQEVVQETGGQYMVGIPAAASWGEFEYIAGGDGERTETGVKQEEYVQAAVDAVKPYLERSQYIGVSLWHMSDPEKDFEEPEKASARTKFPNIIRDSVWKILESY